MVERVVSCDGFLFDGTSAYVDLIAKLDAIQESARSDGLPTSSLGARLREWRDEGVATNFAIPIWISPGHAMRVATRA